MTSYKAVINHNYVFDPSDPFATTYEFTVEGTLASDVGKQLLTDIKDAEAVIFATQAQFTGGVISTYIEDSAPYNPDNLIPKSLSGTGFRVSTEATMADRELAYKVTREPEFGKPGVMQYRGVLLDSDVTTEGAHSILNPSSELNSVSGAAFLEYKALIQAAFVTAGATFCMIGEPLVDKIYHATPLGEIQFVEKVYGDPVVRRVVDINNARVGKLASKHNG